MDLSYFHWNLFIQLVYGSNSLVASGRQIKGKNWYELMRIQNNLSLDDGYAGYALSIQTPGSNVID